MILKTLQKTLRKSPMKLSANNYSIFISSVIMGIQVPFKYLHESVDLLQPIVTFI